MNNPMNSGGTDNGVTFVRFLWEECAAELEQLTQADIDKIAKIVEATKVRPSLWNDLQGKK